MKRLTRVHRKIRLRYAIWTAIIGALLTALGIPCVAAEQPDSLALPTPAADELIVVSQPVGPESDMITEADSTAIGPEAPRMALDTLAIIDGYPRTIYSRPASWTYSDPWWHGMWINTAILSGAFVSTLFVLECLPEDATAWNRKEIASRPFYDRWFNNIFKRGPEWDHDKFIFNYVLHPYAGAAYFMAARSCGFNFWQSMLYSACISTVCWEFGIEACMERPSYQDIVVTPVVGSLIGEGFYRLKREIVNRDYRVLGSPAVGHILAILLDPVNEVVGLLSPSHRCRALGPGCINSQPLLIPNGPGGTAFGVSLSATF